MHKTYKATWDGDRLEWDPGQRPHLTTGARVVVTVLEEPRITELATYDSSAVAAALDRIAELGGIHCFGDPMEWQREIRKDRALPGRDDE